VAAHPNIKAAISFHSYGELILYPYGYTYDAKTSDMTADDHATFLALSRQMAGMNGYTAQQASALYITSGDAGDWLFGKQGVFAVTFEMFPVSGAPAFYPPASVIDRETQRNLPAVVYMARMADAPRKAAGLGPGDITPPAVTLIVDAPAAPRVGDAITLSATANDNVGVTLVAWQVDGATIGLDRTPPFEMVWSPMGSGLKQITALAFDGGGNAGASSALSVEIQRLPIYLPVVVR
jgi:hypothetical protein